MTIFRLAILLFLAACGGTEDTDRPAEEGPFDELTGTLERADAVEEQIMEQKNKLDRALDAADGADDDPPE